MGFAPHFPAAEAIMSLFTSVFNNAATLEHYIGHVMGHRFLWMDTTWHTDSLKQIVRGIRESAPTTPRRHALNGKQVRAMVKIALKQKDIEVAAILTIARHFLFRVPSEAIPSEWGASIPRSSYQRRHARLH